MSIRRRLIAVISAALLLISVNQALVFGQDGGGSGLIISPTRTELEITPGSSDKVSVSLKNVSGADIVAKAEVNDFEADNATGQPKIIPNGDHKSPTSIENFLVDLHDVDLKKDEKKDFDVGVKIPEGTPAGAYYGIIRYTARRTTTSDGQQGGEVSLNASVGTVVLIQIPGNITEQIQIKSQKILRNGKASNFFTSSPQQVAIEIHNNGNGFSKPFGHVSVLKGDQEVYGYELNSADPKGNILPSSSRTFTDDIKNVTKPGRYTIVSNISHGHGGEVLTTKTSFWYVPTWMLITIIAVLVLLVVGGYGLYRKKFSRRRNRRRVK